MEVFRLVGRIVLEGTRQVEQAINNTTTSAARLGQRFENVGSRISNIGYNMALPFGTAAFGIGAAFRKAIGVARDFEQQMDRVGAIAGATAEEMERLNDVALELGASTSKSASEVAVGMENLAAMGFQVNEIIGAMPGVIAAAEASGAEMAQVSDVMASTLNIFGLEASEATRVADILAQTANQSAADINDMQFALKYAGPPANALGISLEELSASIGIMTNAGMRGEQAGTTLRAALLGLLDPSKENAKRMEDMGIQITDTQGNFIGLSALVEDLSEAMEGQTETQKASTLAALVGTEAVSGMLSLMAAGPEEIDKMTTALENSGGMSGKTAQQMKDNLTGALEELGGAVETIQITIGERLTPALRWLTEQLQDVANWFNNLSPTMQNVVIYGTLLAGAFAGIIAVAGVLLALIGGMVTGIGGIVTAWGIFTTTVVPRLVTALVTLTGPIGIVIASITALASLGIYLWQNWETIGPKLQNLWITITNGVLVAWEFIRAYFSNLWSSLTSTMSVSWQGALFFFSGIWESMKNIFALAWDFFLNYTPMGLVIQTIMVNWQALRSFFSILWQTIQALFQLTWQTISHLVIPIVLGLISFLSTSFTNLQNTLFTIMHFIAGIFGPIISRIANTVSSGFSRIYSSATSIFNSVRTFLSNVWSSIYGTISSKASSIYGTVSSVFARVRDSIMNPINRARETVMNALSRIQSAFSNLRLTFPRPKLPHFNITQGSKKVAGVNIPFPKVSIDWFETGGIFDQASVIGVGEGSSREAVIPLEGRYMRPFAEAIASEIPSDADRRGGVIEVPIYLNGREIARASANEMDTQLSRNRRINKRGRGN